MNRKRLLIIIAFVILLCLLGFVWFYFASIKGADDKSTAGNSSSSVKMVACTSTAADQPAKVPNWKTTLYAAPLASNSSNEGVVDNGTRSFPIVKSSKSDAANIYYRVRLDSYTYLPDIGVTLEVCNADNKLPEKDSTAASGPDTSDNVVASVTSLYSNLYQITAPGKYRVDAYLYVDGKWHLTDRLSDVELTK
jgi:hypothetical protein